MCLFLESVKVCDGEVHNLAAHQDRVRITMQDQLSLEAISLEQIIRQQALPASGVYKCRIVYGKGVMHCEVLPYQVRTVRKVQLAETGDFTYPYKSLQRDFFDMLHRQHADVDEFILHHNGILSDSTFSNLAFFDGERWYTPDQPLLKGVRRRQLIECGRLHTAALRMADLSRFSTISFINAMLDLGELTFPCMDVLS